MCYYSHVSIPKHLIDSEKFSSSAIFHLIRCKLFLLLFQTAKVKYKHFFKPIACENLITLKRNKSVCHSKKKSILRYGNKLCVINNAKNSASATTKRQLQSNNLLKKSSIFTTTETLQLKAKNLSSFNAWFSIQ